jgi:hypothetical protein
VISGTAVQQRRQRDPHRKRPDRLERLVLDDLRDLPVLATAVELEHEHM